MNIKQLAVAAAEEQARHTAEEHRLRAEARARENAVLALAHATAVFGTPDEQRDITYVRYDDVWLNIYIDQHTRECYPMLTSPCPTKEGEWHLLDMSTAGASCGSRGVGSYIADLPTLGRVLQHFARAPRMVSCFYCRDAGLAWIDYAYHVNLAD